ncbi:Protein of unknown function [Gryllus bimaculatus]|nr:Protein of unknown function [Gryllus bimaculatus]
MKLQPSTLDKVRSGETGSSGWLVPAPLPRRAAPLVLSRRAGAMGDRWPAVVREVLCEDKAVLADLPCYTEPAFAAEQVQQAGADKEKGAGADGRVLGAGEKRKAEDGEPGRDLKKVGGGAILDLLTTCTNANIVSNCIDTLCSS